MRDAPISRSGPSEVQRTFDAHSVRWRQASGARSLPRRTPDLVREPLAKLQRPLPHRLVTDDDAAGGKG